MFFKISTSAAASSLVMSLGSKYTNLDNVPPMSMPNQGIAEKRRKQVTHTIDKTQIIYKRYGSKSNTCIANSYNVKGYKRMNGNKGIRADIIENV